MEFLTSFPCANQVGMFLKFQRASEFSHQQLLIGVAQTGIQPEISSRFQAPYITLP